MNDKDLTVIIKPLVDQGMDGNEIRAHLLAEHGVDKTFRDLRLLIADCKVVEKKPKKEIPKVATKEKGKIHVVSHISPIQDYLMSGDVSFASDVKGFWFVKKGGTLGLDLSEGDEITKEDLQDLQVELDKIFK